MVRRAATANNLRYRHSDCGASTSVRAPGMKYTQRIFMTPLPHAASFAALNAALADRSQLSEQHINV
jgi:hypothetical protein